MVAAMKKTVRVTRHEYHLRCHGGSAPAIEVMEAYRWAQQDAEAAGVYDEAADEGVIMIRPDDDAIVIYFETSERT